MNKNQYPPKKAQAPDPVNQVIENGTSVTLHLEKGNLSGKIIGFTNIYPSWDKEPTLQYIIELFDGQADYLRGPSGAYIGIILAHPSNITINK